MDTYLFILPHVYKNYLPMIPPMREGKVITLPPCNQPAHQSVCLSVCLSVCVPVYPYVYPSICLSVHLSFKSKRTRRVKLPT